VNKKGKKHVRQNDPYHQREAEKYPNPVASREYILQVLQDFGRPMSQSALFNALQVDSPAKEEALTFRIKAMVVQVHITNIRLNRLCLFEKTNLKKGTIQAHPDGFGFFIPSDQTEDMILSAKEMRAVMHGDEVLAYALGADRRGRLEGKIHEVLTHANKNVVGRFHLEQGIGFVTPDSKQLTQNISIPHDKINQAKEGQIVLVEIVAYPTSRTPAVGQIVHILGEHMAPGMEINIALLAHKIPTEWPENVKKEMTQIPLHVSAEEITGRADLRTLTFVTIDGEDAKDFDDAVCCIQTPKGGFQLYVAIADVSHYVAIDSALDQEAALRGNSVYFPGQVIPMLPEALSNGICSLNPHVDRLCMVMEMNISPTGKITRSKVYRGVIHSQARLTYTQVSAWLEQGATPNEYGHIHENLKALNALYQVLLKARVARGAMDFDSTETRIIFNEQRKIEKIIPLVRNDAHRLIEECMLAANIATARFLEKSGISTLYRTHAPPEPEKITALRAFLGELGLKLSGGERPGPKDFQKTIAELGDRPEKHLVEMVMLRSLKQAHYTPENDGHFGLAYSVYTHFTSPIRRYPDLLIHRAIGHIIDNHDIASFRYSEKNMDHLGKHCSMTERRADEATREVVTWLKCEYMQDKLGQRFDGRISAVTSFGVFVELDKVYVEGLVHITSLKNDYYIYDAVKHRLIGEKRGQRYCLGDKMTVLVARVDLDERKIDFEPIFDENTHD
jgi:ribonuclease R